MLRMLIIVLSRLLSVGLVVAATAVAMHDVRHSVMVAGGLSITTLSDLWQAASAASLEVAGELVTRLTYGWVWDKVLEPLLMLPIALLLGVAGCLFWVGARWAHVSRNAELALPIAPETQARKSVSPGSELAAALASCRWALLSVAVFSAVSNVLVLTGSIFMLEVYDRVLPGRSVPTLVGLAILACVLFAAQGGLDLIRGRILSRIGAALDSAISDRVYDTIVRLPTRVGNRVDSLQSLRDLDNVRSFLSSMGPTALFDLPWIPFYLVIIFSFHTVLGLTALGGALILMFLTLLTEFLTRRPTQAAVNFAASRQRLAEASKRNAEVLMAMGLTHHVGARWRSANQGYAVAHQQASDVGGAIATVSRIIRLMLQSGVLGIGAYLVIQQDATAGIIIAASILTARALAPVDLSIAHWKGFAAARDGWVRLRKVMTVLPADNAVTILPPPTSSLMLESVSVVPPGEQRLVVRDVTFALTRGQGLGIIGPSGSGKSSLARVIIGAWLPARGKVRLDGAALDQWLPESLGRHLGYLPQDVELFAGTVAQNISRFEPDANPEATIRAARAADVHDLIVHLPNGYETQIGEQGAALSAGQRQRIGLARALYGEPFLVVLDEPDANLDSDGIFALCQAILSIRARGGVVIIVAHRHNVLSNVDLLMVLEKGNMLAFGPKDAVMKKLRIPAPGVSPLKVVTDPGASGM